MAMTRIKTGLVVCLWLAQAACSRQSPTPRSAFPNAAGRDVDPLLLPGAPALAKLLVATPGIQLWPSGELRWRAVTQEAPLFADDRVLSDAAGSGTVQLPLGTVSLPPKTSIGFARPTADRKEEISHLALFTGSVEFSLTGALRVVSQPYLFHFRPDVKSGKLKGRFQCTDRLELFLTEGTGEAWERSSNGARVLIAAKSPFRSGCAPLSEKLKPSQLEWNVQRTAAAAAPPPIPARTVSSVGRDIERRRGFEVYWPKGTGQWRAPEIQITGRVTKVGVRLFVNGSEAPSGDGVFDFRVPIPPGGMPVIVQGVDSEGKADFARRIVFRSPR